MYDRFVGVKKHKGVGNMLCTNCGAELVGDAPFCPSCGAQRAAAVQQMQPVQPEQMAQPVYAANTVGDFFSLSNFVIDEKVSAFKFTNAYKVFDANGNQIGTVEQQKISGGAKAARLLLGRGVKGMQAFSLDVKDLNGNVLVNIQRGGIGVAGGIRSVTMTAGTGQPLGTIRVLFSWLKPKLEILDPNEVAVGRIEGDWKGWNFTISDTAGTAIGTVNKKWAGAMKEIFTTADKYHVSISPQAAGAYRMAIVATSVTLDMLLKEFK